MENARWLHRLQFYLKKFPEFHRNFLIYSHFNSSPQFLLHKFAKFSKFSGPGVIKFGKIAISYKIWSPQKKCELLPRACSQNLSPPNNLKILPYFLSYLTSNSFIRAFLYIKRESLPSIHLHPLGIQSPKPKDLLYTAYEVDEPLRNKISELKLTLSSKTLLTKFLLNPWNFSL